VTVQTESFQDAWDKLSSLGFDLVRASFEIGWELAHLAWAVEKGPTKTSASYQDILEVDDLSAIENMQVRAERIAAALWYFKSYEPNNIPSDPNLPAPTVASLKKALDKEPIDLNDVGVQLLALHESMVKACAALDGTTIASGSGGTGNGSGSTTAESDSTGSGSGGTGNGSGSTTAESGSTGSGSGGTGNGSGSSGLLINGLKEGYEVGRLLAAVVLQAGQADDVNGFKQYLSITEQNETLAFRAHSLLGGLRDCFPSAAAYSVARHLEDWSDWLNGNPVDCVDYPAEPFNEAQAKTAILGQGRVWRAILSGQTLARDYIVATSVADAANRLFVSWSASATAIARSFIRTALARFFLVLGIIVLLVFFGAFLVDLLTHDGGTSGAKNGLTITAIVAAAASAAGIFHVSRTQVTSALGGIWSMVERPMVETELIESIALSTRRLPLDTVGGPAPPQAKTMKDRLQRARRGSLLSASKRQASQWKATREPASRQ
jgi:hypothetical protein